MNENIRDFFLRFTEEELAGRGILRGQTRMLQQVSVAPLIALMNEQKVQKLECQDCTWFLDVERNFSNPNTYFYPNSVFEYQNVHLNPCYRGYRQTQATVADYEIENLAAEATTITFGLERDLQEALRANIEQLEPGLKILDGGTEQTVPAGKIDITAEDSEGRVVVIELKAHIAQPADLTQVLAYMGTISQDKKVPSGVSWSPTISTRE